MMLAAQQSIFNELTHQELTFLREFITQKSGLADKDWTDYDKGVQEVLDEYWPGSEITGVLKRMEVPIKCVYTSEFEGEEVVVKSVDYTPELEKTSKDYALFIDFVGEAESVAGYIDPDVVHSDDKTKLVTMSQFAHGCKPQELAPNDYAWIENENIVRTEAAWWSGFRARSVEFKSAHPEEYESYPTWDTFQDGW